MMYNTGNPVGSDDARDFIDDVVVVDNFTTLQQRTSTDRLGVQRNTLFGIEQEGKDAAEAMGWFPVAGSFESGGTITARNQVLWWEAAKSWYSWRGTLPKTVAAGSTPAKSGGFGETAWIDRTDATLRTRLLKRPLRAAMSDIYGLADHVSVKDYGAIGDGTLHTLQEWVDSGRFSGLAAIKVAYPHVTSLTQSIDWAAIQAAIATGRSVWNPKGDYWISNEIEQVTPGQVIEFEGTGGYGYTDDGDGRHYWRPNTRWIAYGTGFTADARVRTRRKHRSSAADPQDAAMSVVLNVQAEGVVLVRPCVWLNCDYSNPSPDNLGDACDVGIFIGCRPGVKIVDPQVIGYFRMSGIHWDVTHDSDLPRHLDKKGNPYPQSQGTNISGADGCSMVNPYIIGARRGNVIAGALPAAGQTWYGPAYYDEQLGTTVADSRGSFGFSDFIVHGGRIFGPDHHSNRRLANPTLSGGTLNETSLNSENELMPCANFIDGMAGNASHTVWGIRFIGTRIASFEAFRSRLNRAARVHFIACHHEGRNGGRFSTTGSSINTNDYTTISYGDISGTSNTSRVLIDGSVRTDTSDAYPHYYGTAISAHIDYGEAWYESYQPSRAGADFDMRVSGNPALFRWRWGADSGVTLSRSAMTFLSGVFSSGVNIVADSGLLRLSGATETRIDAVAGDVVLRAATGYAVRMRYGGATMATVLATGITSYGTLSAIKPGTDNTVPICTASARATTIYLGTAPNVTSDASQKTGIKPIDDVALDAWGDVHTKAYQLIDGTSDRFHTGFIVQDIIAAFDNHGLDALEYGLCCHESWGAKPAVIDGDGEIIEPAVAAGDIWTLRYDEAFAFEAAWNRRELGRTKSELDGIKARLAALEAK